MSDARRRARDSVPGDGPQCDHRARSVLRPDRGPLRDHRANGRRRWPRSSCAGVLDGFDGRIARLLRAQSKFGAELDSLERQYRLRHRAGADPVPVVAAERAAVRLDRRAGAGGVLRACGWRGSTRGSMPAEQPHKSAGFNTGVPAPVGAGLAFVPDLSVADHRRCDCSSDWRLVMPWTLFIAVLMISSVPTYTWVDPDPPRLAAVRAGRGGVARRGAAQRAVADLAGDFGRSIWRCCRSAWRAMPGSSGGAQPRLSAHRA